MRKTIGIIVSLLMILTMIPLQSYGWELPTSDISKYTDVSEDAWYRDYVCYVTSQSYMVGTSETTFEPQGNLTRAMFVTVLARYDEAAVDDSKTTIFKDVQTNQWYTVMQRIRFGADCKFAAN